ncbi:hypothetical protein E2C01_099434 [Portunus trituberculatus]|uniref:Uncharacterized protein n=1 Tax=Portunus trituberculatus TaxID=210409 RepID=A0A5B7K9L7_PORTR|nr:hypothetical protein [Portunus trituberculatus]
MDLPPARLTLPSSNLSSVTSSSSSSYSFSCSYSPLLLFTTTTTTTNTTQELLSLLLPPLPQAFVSRPASTTTNTTTTTAEATHLPRRYGPQCSVTGVLRGVSEGCDVEKDRWRGCHVLRFLLSAKVERSVAHDARGCVWPCREPSDGA